MAEEVYQYRVSKIMLMESGTPAIALGTTQLILYTDAIQRMTAECGHNSNCGASLYQVGGQEEAGTGFMHDKDMCSPEQTGA